VAIIVISTSLSDLPATVGKRGWIIGGVVGVAVVTGAVITIFDIVPRFCDWVEAFHQAIKGKVNAIEEKLYRTTALVRQVFRDPPANE
jgi:hypothetical protein